MRVAETGPPALLIRGASMRFGPRLVLDSLDLDVERGQVHALLGANGSGKSTSVKIISGNYEPTSIERFELVGEQVPLPTTVPDMQTRGLRTVHQELGLVEELSIAENIALGRHYQRAAGGRIDWRGTRASVEAALDLVGLHRAPAVLVARLAAWERVAVVFARAMYGGLDQVQLLVLDEITAALPAEEVARVMEVIGRVKNHGAGVLYITHRFEEVFEIADLITVLRDGKIIHNGATSEITPPELVELVAGQAIEPHAARVATGTDSVVLSVDNVANSHLNGVTFTVGAGEIVGLVGRAGCGRSAIGRVIFGLESTHGGTVSVAGRPVAPGKPWRSLAAGVGYVGQDRRRAGAISGASTEENLTITALGGLTRSGWLLRRREGELADQLITSCHVVPPDPRALIETLSGGNQQKVVVGRWIPRAPKVLVLDEPTEGVDVGARQSIYTLIHEQAARGCAVLVLSSSIEELTTLCDRVLCLVDGEVSDELRGDALTVQAIESFLLLRASARNASGQKAAS
jgi:ribose transport system ATP-binding protein